MASILPIAAYLMQAGRQGPVGQIDPMMANQQATPEEEIVAKGLDPIEHKGLFGVKGTLRDVLGLLGDSYLMVNGRNPYYAPIRREELLGSEMAGRYQNNEEENFINNPQLVAQRLAESGFGKEASGVYQDFTKNEADKAEQLNAQAQLARQNARDDQLAKQGDVLAQKNFIEGVLSKTYSGISDEATLKRFNQWALPKLEALGLAGYELPQNLNDAKRFGIQPYQQERLRDFDQGLGIQQQNADTNQATSRPRSDTPVELFERYSSIPADKRTPEQQAFITKYTSTGKRSGRRTGGGGGSEGLPPRPGEYKGQTATSPSGIRYSWDGKSWKRQ